MFPSQKLSEFQQFYLKESGIIPNTCTESRTPDKHGLEL